MRPVDHFIEAARDAGMLVCEPVIATQVCLLRAIEELIELPLPDEFRDFYTTCDGSGWFDVLVTEPDISPRPICPVLPLVDILVNVAYFDKEHCNGLAEEYPDWNEASDFENRGNPRVTSGKIWTPRWIGLGNRQEIMMDMEPGPSGNLGQVCFVSGSFPALDVRFNSFGEFILQAASDMRRFAVLPTSLASLPYAEWRESVLKKPSRFEPVVVQAMSDRMEECQRITDRFGFGERISIEDG